MADTVPTSPDQELKAVTQQLYDQNVELAIRNKTLGILRKLYEITMTSLNVQTVSQKIIDTLEAELAFPVVLITLIDDARQVLYPIAISNTPKVTEAIAIIQKDFAQITTPMTETGNLIVKCITTGERAVTGNLFDILYPHVTQDIADKIENITDVNTAIVFPFAVDGHKIGAISIGLAKQVESLSRAEKETLEEIIDVVAIAIDRAQLHESVQRANEELKQLDKVKDEFLSMASHELKSPMNAISNYLWLAMKKGKESPEKMDEYLNTAFKSTQRLIALVNDLLDVSRIESGRITLDIKSLDLSVVANETLAIFDPQAKQKNLILTSQIPQGTTAQADDTKLREVLSNLISNAVKYTPAGSITITISDQGEALRINVTDTGTGISPDDQAKIFQKFTRVNNSFKELATIEGTGLGLWIAKQFIEKMGGTIGVDSEVGKGSTFWFTLPKATNNTLPTT